jgi:hypothetical protein
MNAQEETTNAIERAMNLKSFKIVKPTPDDFEFNGRVPFDISIKDGVMVFKVFAVTLAEADAKVEAFLDERTRGY